MKKEYIQLNKSVAIVGCAMSNMHFHLDSTADEMWGFAWINEHKLFHKVFDLHPLDANRKLTPEFYISNLINLALDGRLVINYPDKRFEGAQVYPIQQVIEKVSKRVYFKSSLAYMVALAIYEEFSTIEIYGIDFQIWNKIEAKQLANFEYFLGLAEGKGIEVKVSPYCDLLENTYMYGYHWNTQVADMPHIKFKREDNE